MRSMGSWVVRARKFKAEAHALYMACRDPRTPWYAKAFAALVVAYAFSPIDLIPDPIPIIGHLDDVILVPLGVWIAAKMIPAEVLDECRARVAERHKLASPRSRWMVAAIITVWIAVACLLGYFLLRS